MAKSIRRIVTGHDPQGKAIFIIDDLAPAVHRARTGGVVSTELWSTRSMPASNTGKSDPTIDHPYRLPPPKNGTVFRIVEYPPDAQRVATLRQSSEEIASEAASDGYTRDLQHKRHPGFHKTASVDYAIVLSGEIYALVDEGETLLKAGDVLIQQGTNHAWSNRTKEPCQVAFVLIDAEPI